MAFAILPPFLQHFLSSTLTATPRPGLQPIPGSRPLTLEALLCPVLLYYIALLLLPPPTSRSVELLRNVLAGTAAVFFLRLPLSYHVPQSIGLTYQLGLVGVYGGLRVLDAFFLSVYGFHHVPRRVRYVHHPVEETPKLENGNKLQRPVLGSRATAQSDLLENMTSENYTDILSRDESYTSKLAKLLDGPSGIPVLETARSEEGYPTGFLDRMSWALELELSMRGVGFTWTTADVRHTRKTWLPSVSNRIHSILFHVGPVVLAAWAVIRTVYVQRIAGSKATSPFDELSLPEQYALTTALGAFLMAAFSLGHSMFAIVCAPLAPSPLAFFPPLYTTPVWEIKSARGFWSYGWHRLFARLFLVWGVWPGEWVERTLLGKGSGEAADVGKVIGGFLSSAIVHSFSVRGVLGGRWEDAAGEAKFFALNGIAIVAEEVVKKIIRKWRGDANERWYDAWVGRVWWIGLLLTTGRNFARGWTKAGLVREMAFM